MRTSGGGGRVGGGFWGRARARAAHDHPSLSLDSRSTKTTSSPRARRATARPGTKAGRGRSISGFKAAGKGERCRGWGGGEHGRRANLRPLAFPLSRSVDFAGNTACPDIDFATIHVYPDNWKVSADEERSLWVEKTFMRDRAAIAKSYGKPIIMEEYGMMTGREREGGWEVGERARRRGGRAAAETPPLLLDPGYFPTRDELMNQLQDAANDLGFAATLVWACYAWPVSRGRERRGGAQTPGRPSHGLPPPVLPFSGQLGRGPVQLSVQRGRRRGVGAADRARRLGDRRSGWHGVDSERARQGVVTHHCSFRCRRRVRGQGDWGRLHVRAAASVGQVRRGLDELWRLLRQILWAVRGAAGGWGGGGGRRWRPAPGASGAHRPGRRRRPPPAAAPPPSRRAAGAGAAGVGSVGAGGGGGRRGGGSRAYLGARAAAGDRRLRQRGERGC